MAMVNEPTHMLCPDAPGYREWAEGRGSKDNLTHHLVPQTRSGARVHACRHCGKTEKQLREDADRG